jgi:hypothetical protein
LDLFLYLERLTMNENEYILKVIYNDYGYYVGGNGGSWLAIFFWPGEQEWVQASGRTRLEAISAASEKLDKALGELKLYV